MRSLFPLAALALALAVVAAGPADARGNLVFVDQKGRNLSGSIVQAGNGNAAALVQRGADNTGAIVQQGDGARGCLIQVGQNLDGELVQGDGATGTFLQNRRGVTAVPDSVCAPGRWGVVRAPARATGPRPGMTWPR